MAVVHLVDPPQKYLRTPGALGSLGLLSVAAVVREAGHEVHVWDMTCLDEEGVVNRLFTEVRRNRGVENVIGLTGSSLDIPTNNRILRLLKVVLGDRASLIVGGAGATLSPEFYDMENIDLLVRGEGEYVLTEWLSQSQSERATGVFERAGFIEDLDKLPYPARDLVEIYTKKILETQYIGDKTAVVMTSRGCPYACIFCASRGMWERKVRYRSVGHVEGELHWLAEKFGVRQFRFVDDTVTMNLGRLSALCDVLFVMGDVAWRASVRAKPNGLEMFQRMRYAGCREILIGVESGDQDVLDKLQKGATVEDNLTAVTNASRAGLVVRMMIMVGTPGETSKTVRRNKEFIKAVPCDSVVVKSFVPLPGSAVWSDPEAYGVQILDRDLEHYNFNFWTADGEAVLYDLIEVEGLTLEELRSNKAEIRDFVSGLGKVNMV